MNIAFLGLGRMGSGMAACLAKTGSHSLTVWNRNPDKTLTLQDLGAKAASDPASAIENADLVITSLMDDRSVEDIFNAQSRALAAMRPGAIHLCVTTISPDCSNRLQALHAAHGSRYLSGPVVGRPDTAADGKLLQFLAGDAGAAAEVEPICHAFAARVLVLPGPAGVANGQKLCINFFVVALIEAMGECMTLGEKLGVSREVLARFFEQSLALPELKAYSVRILSRTTDGKAGFTMAAGRKDVRLMEDAAASVTCPLDIAGIIASKMDAALAQGMDQFDWSAIQEVTRQRANLEAKTAA